MIISIDVLDIFNLAFGKVYSIKFPFGVIPFSGLRFINSKCVWEVKGITISGKWEDENVWDCNNIPIKNCFNRYPKRKLFYRITTLMAIMISKKTWIAVHSFINAVQLCTIFLLMLFFSCSNRERILTGKHGYYWDVIYISNTYWNQPVQGYCFRPDGLHYAYHYYGEGRTPFDIDLADASTPITIEANLRPWRFLSDTTIQIGSRKYIIDLKKDTISLRTGIPQNPIIKLLRVE